MGFGWTCEGVCEGGRPFQRIWMECVCVGRDCAQQFGNTYST